MIAAFKALHIAAMLCWCAGLVALPILLALYGRAREQARYAEFRQITHYGYVAFASPAAVIAIAAGSVLIFLRDVFDIWFLAKLVTVSGMALVHAWLGHMILQSGEQAGQYRMPPPLIALGLVLPLMGMTLWLVLAKPDLADVAEAWLPDFLLAPQGRGLGLERLPM